MCVILVLKPEDLVVIYITYCIHSIHPHKIEKTKKKTIKQPPLFIVFPVAFLLVILLVLRRRKDTDSELSAARAPLLRKERPQGRYHGMPCDAEPVYAGW